MKTSQTSRLKGLALAVALGAATLAGCTTTVPTASTTASTVSTQHMAIDSQVDASLLKLYNQVPGSRELIARSKAVLVFPGVIKGSFIVGAEYGRGALRVDNKTSGYFSTTAASLGLQAGGQSKDVFYVFTNTESLNQFLSSTGWTAGVDGNVAVANLGMNGTIDTNTLTQPVVAFVLTNVGLEAGVSVQGAKINRLP